MLLAAIFWKGKLYLQVLGHVPYAAVMLLKFYKITSLEKKNIYTSFQQATRLSFTGFSSCWKYRLGVFVGLPTHRLLVGVGVRHASCPRIPTLPPPLLGVATTLSLASRSCVAKPDTSYPRYTLVPPRRSHMYQQ